MFVLFVEIDTENYKLTFYFYTKSLDFMSSKLLIKYPQKVPEKIVTNINH